jgi:hypothetical protein
VTASTQSQSFKLSMVIRLQIEGIVDKHFSSYCSYSSSSLVGWVLCFTRRWFIDTYSACYRGNLNCSISFDWQKTLEITNIFFCKHKSSLILT